MIGHVFGVLCLLWTGAGVGYFVRGFCDACKRDSEALDEPVQASGLEDRVRRAVA